MNKVVYVKAYTKRDNMRTRLDASAGNAVKESPQAKRPPCEIDDLRLAKDIGKAIQRLNLDGYEIISVSEITSGCCIEGILVVARKKSRACCIQE